MVANTIDKDWRYAPGIYAPNFKAHEDPGSPPLAPAFSAGGGTELLLPSSRASLAAADVAVDMGVEQAPEGSAAATQEEEAPAAAGKP